ncbi:amino acid/amide ABC transporter ATP-binding protein 1 (HAAT family) [Hoeflea marina]|uniref:Amino acid/amide ABC transporter ATP-binding protein 1 (HAAT family) n=1 Tax=Hoeflea marina TaxID=274592 RepID=A0A317PK82_9HYPH|nr:ABC transporter ATP-binding protein [Hoeflea marina]PWW01382.1 amino acid/amide ABC transporter ATP-binding protein 1 (HAAT family) [Hoeflea marina]
MTEPVLSLSGVTRSFGALKVSDAVDLDLRAGEIHALIGPNGAGKSTLIKLISGEIEPDAGRIRFAGRDLQGLDQAARARLGLARTFQVSSLIPDFSVRRNVMLAVQAREGSGFGFVRQVSGDSRLGDAAMTALGRVGLQDRAQVPAAELSHGERRLLEIAMALALRPRAFLMDEPMAGLGSEGSGALIGFLDSLRGEAPILLVEHDMDAVFALADRISVLVGGRVIAHGSPDDIRADADVRAAYLGEE